MRQSHFSLARILLLFFTLLPLLNRTTLASELDFSQCRISKEENPSFSDPNYDDSKWTPGISTPGSPGEVFLIRCHGKAVQEKSDSVLHIGRIADEDETYFNGVLVGRSLGAEPATRWNYFFSRTYFIPKSIISTT